MPTPVESTRVPFTFEELLILRDALTVLLVSPRFGHDSVEEGEIIRTVRRRLTGAINSTRVS